MKSELDESQKRVKAELQRNVEIVKGNKELEELLRRKEEQEQETESELQQVKVIIAETTEKNHNLAAELEKSNKYNEKLIARMEK